MEDKKIGYLIRNVTHAFRYKVNRLMIENGMPDSYGRILGFLNDNSQKIITQKDICEHMGHKAPTISITLQNMEDEGLITRTKCPTDSRKIILSLTDLGVKKHEDIKGIFMITENMINSSMTKEELDEFERCLKKILKVLEEK